jgi:hypothetical protein
MVVSHVVSATQQDSHEPEGENLRQGSADRPFNWEISLYTATEPLGEIRGEGGTGGDPGADRQRPDPDQDNFINRGVA